MYIDEAHTALDILQFAAFFIFEVEYLISYTQYISLLLDSNAVEVRRNIEQCFVGKPRNLYIRFQEEACFL